MNRGGTNGYCATSHDGGAVCRGWDMPLYVSEAGSENKEIPVIRSGFPFFLFHLYLLTIHEWTYIIRTYNRKFHSPTHFRILHTLPHLTSESPLSAAYSVCHATKIVVSIAAMLVWSSRSASLFQRVRLRLLLWSQEYSLSQRGLYTTTIIWAFLLAAECPAGWKVWR